MLPNDPFETLQSPPRTDLSLAKPLLILANGAAAATILQPMLPVVPMRR